MILDEFTEIKASYYYLKRLSDEYPEAKKGEIIKVRVSDLSKDSHIKINVKCDVCSKVKMISYSKYNKNISNGGYYSCSQSCSKNKNKETYFKKTGYANHMLNPEVVEKHKKTCMERFGVNHPKKVKDFKEKAIQTCIKNHGVEYGMLLEKSKDTMIEKFGFDNPMKSKEILGKAQRTNVERYGHKTSLLNSEVKERSRITMIEKFGTEHALQNPEIMESMLRKSSKYALHEIGIYYQGTYEKDFLDFCLSNMIDVKRGPTLKYINEGIEHFYYSDFYIESINLIVEVKSSYYYYLHESINILKKECAINSGYSFMFVLDKEYSEITNAIKKAEF